MKWPLVVHTGFKHQPDAEPCGALAWLLSISGVFICKMYHGCVCVCVDEIVTVVCIDGVEALSLSLL